MTDTPGAAACTAAEAALEAAAEAILLAPYPKVGPGTARDFAGRALAAAQPYLEQAACADLVAKLRGLHRPFGIYDQCDHDHTTEEVEAGTAVNCGDFYSCRQAWLYDICAHCCLYDEDDPGTGPTERCFDTHDHGPGKPICETATLLDTPAAATPCRRCRRPLGDGAYPYCGDCLAYYQDRSDTPTGPTMQIGADLDLLCEAVTMAASGYKISRLNVQRRLRVGFAKADRLVLLMEDHGVIGAQERGVHEARIGQPALADTLARLRAAAVHPASGATCTEKGNTVDA